MLLTFLKNADNIPSAFAQNITNKIRSGSELTICVHDKYAYLDMFTKDEIEVNYYLARSYVEIGLVTCTGGNIETGERQYVVNQITIK